jgi:hypothetical protein
LRYSLETKMAAEAVRTEALAYFRDRLGLRVTNDEENALCLEGGGGYVTILVCPGDKTSIEIETREWDNAVTDFLTKIHK